MADVLEFAFSMVVDDGRLCMWMPTANDEDVELAIPHHPGLQLVSVCVQDFNKCTYLTNLLLRGFANESQGRDGY